MGGGHNKDGAIKQGVQQMCPEDNHSPLHSLLKAVRQFVNPPSPRPCTLQWVLFAGEEEDRVMAQNDFLRLQLLHSSQCCSITRERLLPPTQMLFVPQQMCPSLCFSLICPPPLNSFALWAPQCLIFWKNGGWRRNYKGREAGLGVRPRHMALSEGEIYVCFKGRGREVYIAVTCVHFELSGCFHKARCFKASTGSTTSGWFKRDIRCHQRMILLTWVTHFAFVQSSVVFLCVFLWCSFQYLIQTAAHGARWGSSHNRAWLWTCN